MKRWRAKAVAKMQSLFFLKPQPPKKRTLQHTPLGVHYNLQEIYDNLNARYFDGRLQLKITWFGNQSRPATSRRILGLYLFQEKVIKIHRLLDHPDFPPYFISYVVYHEMLHNVFPPLKKKRKQRRRIHHADFKEHEKKFAEYAEAKQWEKQNAAIFFSKRGTHGRAQ